MFDPFSLASREYKRDLTETSLIKADNYSDDMATIVKNLVYYASHNEPLNPVERNKAINEFFLNEIEGTVKAFASVDENDGIDPSNDVLMEQQDSDVSIDDVLDQRAQAFVSIYREFKEPSLVKEEWKNYLESLKLNTELSSDEATDDTVGDVSDEAADDTVGDVSDEATDDIAGDVSDEVADDTVGDVSDEAADDIADDMSTYDAINTALQSDDATEALQSKADEASKRFDSAMEAIAKIDLNMLPLSKNWRDRNKDEKERKDNKKKEEKEMEYNQKKLDAQYKARRRNEERENIKKAMQNRNKKKGA